MEFQSLKLLVEHIRMIEIRSIADKNPVHNSQMSFARHPMGQSPGAANRNSKAGFLR